MAYTVCRLSCLSLFSLLVKHKDRQRPRQKKKRGAFNGDEQIRPSGYSKSSDPSHFPASPPLVSALTVTSLQTNSSNLFAWREREREAVLEWPRANTVNQQHRALCCLRGALGL